MRTYRIGSRGSKLALWQAEHVAARLKALYPQADFPIVVIHTTGDRRTDVPLSSIGDKSLFIKEIEAALLSGDVELAVHSLKDVPSRLDGRFNLAAILEREDPRDVLITPELWARHGDRRPADSINEPDALNQLPRGALVGTSSLRREAQLRAARPDIRFAPLRGNVDTRLRKLREGEYQAVVLAAAGLRRLGVDVPAEAYLDPKVCLPAPGQAAMCVEVAEVRADVAALLKPLDHQETRAAVTAERTFAAALDAGCEVPLGALASQGDAGLEIRLHTVVASTDGTRLVRTSGSGPEPEAVGRDVAARALAQGAADLLAAARSK